MPIFKVTIPKDISLRQKEKIMTITDDKLELNLFENGIDFLLRGIDEFYDDDFEVFMISGFDIPNSVPLSRYKYVCLHLFSGFLLLLKERLARHLPELIYKIKDKKISAIKTALAKNDDLFTVDLDTALELLEIGPKVTFTAAEIKTIQDIQKDRNRFEHYKVSVDKKKLWSTIMDFLELVDKFLAEQLSTNLEESTDNYNLRQKIHNIAGVWHRILKGMEKDWENEINAKLRDFINNRESLISQLAEIQLENNNSVMPYMVCPTCKNETLIVSGDYTGICTNQECYAAHPITECSMCGKAIIGFSWESGYCSICYEEIIRDY